MARRAAAAAGRKTERLVRAFHQDWGFDDPVGTLASSRMRLTGPKRPTTLTTVAAAVVLLATSALAGRGDSVGPFTGTASLGSGAGAPVAERAVRVPTISVGQARVRDTKGTPKLPPSAFAHLDIPATALHAYQSAAAVMEQADESCGLSWTLLAAIGRVESDHGRYAGGRLRADGTSSRAIRGVTLDGSGPLARIRDTDAGQLDDDPVWDRAVGPMQLLPSTWSVLAVDADGDGVRSPDDIDDAALAAALFLCSAPGDLDTRSGVRAAVFRYNPSSSYVASVLALERSYRTGEFDTLGDAAPVDPVEIILVTRPGRHTAGTQSGSGRRGGPDASRATRAGAGPDHHVSNPTTHSTHDPTASADPSATDPPSSTGTQDSGPTGAPDQTGAPDPGPTGAPGPAGTPDPTADPMPTQTPDPGPTADPAPAPVQLTGVLTACGPEQAQWCLDGQVLDVGDTDVLATAAASDLDGDGVVESATEELTGLAGTEVTVLVAPGTAPAVVEAINGAVYDPEP